LVSSEMYKSLTIGVICDSFFSSKPDCGTPEIQPGTQFGNHWLRG
jgi:hypothetical protein